MSYLSEIEEEERTVLAVRLAAHMLMPPGSKAEKRGITEAKLAKFAARVDDALVLIGIEDTVQSMVDRGVLERVPGDRIQRGPNWESRYE